MTLDRRVNIIASLITAGFFILVALVGSGVIFGIYKLVKAIAGAGE